MECSEEKNRYVNIIFQKKQNPEELPKLCAHYFTVFEEVLENVATAFLHKREDLPIDCSLQINPHFFTEGAVLTWC